MKVTAIKTKKVVVGDKLVNILDEFLPKLSENDVVIITSKIVAISQGRVVKNDGKVNKIDLMKKEAQLYLPEHSLMYGIHLTITNNTFVVSAGIDESNGDGYFILWPKDVQKAVSETWEYLRKKHGVKNLGVIVTDSKLSPLRKGVTAMGLAWCGFLPLRDYVGEPDVFGRIMKVEKQNLVDGIATAAEVVMGEGKEQTPFGIVSEIPDIEFVERTPTKEEIEEMSINPEDDVFGALIKAAPWEKGGV